MNVCPDKRGLFADIDVSRLKEMVLEIKDAFAHPVAEKQADISFGDNTYFDISFNRADIRKIVLREDLTKSQRVEAFELFVKQQDGYHKVYTGTTIGSKKIIVLPEFGQTNISGIRIQILQCRSTPKLNFIGVYA